MVRFFALPVLSLTQDIIFLSICSTPESPLRSVCSLHQLHPFPNQQQIVTQSHRLAEFLKKEALLKWREDLTRSSPFKLGIFACKRWWIISRDPLTYGNQFDGLILVCFPDVSCMVERLSSTVLSIHQAGRVVESVIVPLTVKVG